MRFQRRDRLRICVACSISFGRFGSTRYFLVSRAQNRRLPVPEYSFWPYTVAGAVRNHSAVGSAPKNIFGASLVQPVKEGTRNDSRNERGSNRRRANKAYFGTWFIYKSWSIEPVVFLKLFRLFLLSGALVVHMFFYNVTRTVFVTRTIICLLYPASIFFCAPVIWRLPIFSVLFLACLLLLPVFRSAKSVFLIILYAYYLVGVVIVSVHAILSLSRCRLKMERFRGCRVWRAISLCTLLCSSVFIFFNTNGSKMYSEFWISSFENFLFAPKWIFCIINKFW